MVEMENNNSSNSSLAVHHCSRDSRRYSNISMLSALSSSASSHFEYSPEDDDPFDEPHSFDLLPASASSSGYFSIEDRADKVFGHEHLKTIFRSSSLLSHFTDFLTKHRPKSLDLLVYYLDATKALRAIAYANAIAAGLEEVDDQEFTVKRAPATDNSKLQQKADQAFQELVDQELSAYVTHIYVEVVSHNIRKRITGSLRSDLKDAVDGLGECFCLTDPNRRDNPIIFMSEEFNRTTQYGVSYAIDTNCRFLQGPRTAKTSIQRLSKAIKAGEEVSEIFLNYRRDGSPFMNLLLCAPLRDSRGEVRYFLGAQVDVSSLVKEGIGLESMRELDRLEAGEGSNQDSDAEIDEFRELTELFNDAEIETTQEFGGRLHKAKSLKNSPSLASDLNMGGRRDPRASTRLVVKDAPPDKEKVDLSPEFGPPGAGITTGTGLLKGVYQHYLLVRPYPSLRILFTSPSLRTPGIFQTPLMSKITAAPRVLDELHNALKNGRSVTSKVTWITKRDTEEGRERWVHCTPLLDAKGDVGVWMVVVVDAPEPARPPPVRIYRTPTPIHRPQRGLDDIDNTRCKYKAYKPPSTPPINEDNYHHHPPPHPMASDRYIYKPYTYNPQSSTSPPPFYDKSRGFSGQARINIRARSDFDGDLAVRGLSTPPKTSSTMGSQTSGISSIHNKDFRL